MLLHSKLFTDARYIKFYLHIYCFFNLSLDCEKDFLLQIEYLHDP